MFESVWLGEKLNIEERGCVLLLGGFDGLHAGHKTLMERAKGYGLPIGAMTIIGGKEGAALFTLAERLDIFTRAGAQLVLPMPFADIKDLSPETFAQDLEARCNPKAFICGDDFRFGKSAQGNGETLKSATHVRVETVELLKKDGEKISATRIKNHLAKGEIEAANELLGERFFLIGEVVKDRGVGRTLRFPTANIAYPEGKFPLKKGVYETRVSIDGKVYKGITNFGARPTFYDGSVCTETHVLHFDGDLYGKTVKVEFARYMRDITKFDGVEGLQAQLERDRREVDGRD